MSQSQLTTHSRARPSRRPTLTSTAYPPGWVGQEGRKVLGERGYERRRARTARASARPTKAQRAPSPPTAFDAGATAQPELPPPLLAGSWPPFAPPVGPCANDASDPWLLPAPPLELPVPCPSDASDPWLLPAPPLELPVPCPSDASRAMPAPELELPASPCPNDASNPEPWPPVLLGPPSRCADVGPPPTVLDPPSR